MSTPPFPGLSAAVEAGLHSGIREVANEAITTLVSEAGVLLSVPNGAFYIMADIAPKGMPARSLAFALLRQKGVSVAPGSAFGEQELGTVRISLASSDSDLREGVSRLCDFVRAG